MCFTPWSLSALMTISDPVSSGCAAAAVFPLLFDLLIFEILHARSPTHTIQNERGVSAPCITRVHGEPKLQLRPCRGPITTRTPRIPLHLSKSPATLVAAQYPVKQFHAQYYVVCVIKLLILASSS